MPEQPNSLKCGRSRLSGGVIIRVGYPVPKASFSCNDEAVPTDGNGYHDERVKPLKTVSGEVVVAIFM